MGEKSTRRPCSLRRKLVIGGVVGLLVLGIVLGLGLGLTIGRNNGGGNVSFPSPTSSPLATPSAKLPWTPAVNETWQIVLENNIELFPNATSVTPNVSVYDIDLFDTPKETIDTLHRMGIKVLCYFSAGSFEEGRPDAWEFQQSDMGKTLDGWPDEKWLKLGSENVRMIMKQRIQLAANKSCDGIDPDNVDGYDNDNGLGLTPDDSISFLSYLSSVASPLGLAMGLKNAGEIIPQVLPVVQFSVNEQCVENDECDTFDPFIAAGKPVFHIEYPDGAGKNIKVDTVRHYCNDQGDAEGEGSFSTVLKTMDLDGWVQFCNGDVAVTPLNQTAGS